jgi:lipopolysaccharide export system ATP-binding protein
VSPLSKLGSRPPALLRKKRLIPHWTQEIWHFEQGIILPKYREMSPFLGDISRYSNVPAVAPLPTQTSTYANFYLRKPLIFPENPALKLVLDNIHKSYSKRTIVNRVNLSVSMGEIVGLLGPNGAGKTTTFYIATGLERPDQGKVWLNDQEVTALPMNQRARLGVGYLAQEASIFRHLSVQDNILLVMQQTDVPPAEYRDRLYYLLKEFRLEKIAHTPGNRVSGGERRRTEIARALASGKDGPKFLFLDEPFAGIDPIAVAEIQEIIAGLRDRHMGILITDHNVRETLAITDRSYIMRDGQILASGSSDELYANPLVRQYYLGDGFSP